MKQNTGREGQGFAAMVVFLQRLLRYNNRIENFVDMQDKSGNLRRSQARNYQAKELSARLWLRRQPCPEGHLPEQDFQSVQRQRYSLSLRWSLLNDFSDCVVDSG